MHERPDDENGRRGHLCQRRFSALDRGNRARSPAQLARRRGREEERLIRVDGCEPLFGGLGRHWAIRYEQRYSAKRCGRPGRARDAHRAQGAGSPLSRWCSRQVGAQARWASERRIRRDARGFGCLAQRRTLTVG